MHPLVTLTLNPSVDTSLEVDRVEPGIKMRCARVHRDPGGGGVNVARAAVELGGEAAAVFPAGGHTGEELTDLVESCGVRVERVAIENQTRENIAVTELDSGHQFRFNMPGAALTQAEQQRCLDAVDRSLTRGGTLVISGSLPPGVDAAFGARVVAHAREREVRTVADSSGEALTAIAGAGPFLLKPNRRELRQLTGRECSTVEEVFDAASSLVDEGAAEVVVVSLAEAGACLVSRQSRLFAGNLDVEVKSAIGAGDSMVGAIALALVRGLSEADMLSHGVAAGAAACATPGTHLLKREGFERLLGAVGVEDRSAP